MVACNIVVELIRIHPNPVLAFPLLKLRGSARTERTTTTHKYSKHYDIDTPFASALMFRSRSWEQFVFHAHGVFAAVVWPWALANHREEERERAGQLELRRYLRRDAFRGIREGYKARLEGHEELERLHKASRWQ